MAKRKTLYRFIAMVTPKIKTNKLQPSSQLEVSAFAHSLEEAKRVIKNRYIKDGRYELNDLYFIGAE